MEQPPKPRRKKPTREYVTAKSARRRADAKQAGRCKYLCGRAVTPGTFRRLGMDVPYNSCKICRDQLSITRHIAGLRKQIESADATTVGKLANELAHFLAMKEDKCTYD